MDKSDNKNINNNDNNNNNKNNLSYLKNYDNMDITLIIHTFLSFILLLKGSRFYIFLIIFLKISCQV